MNEAMSRDPSRRPEAPPSTGPVCEGDFVRALACLDVGDDGTAGTIAHLLGLEGDPVETAQPDPAPSRHQPPVVTRQEASPQLPTPSAGQAPPTETASPVHRQHISSLLEEVEDGGPAWSLDVDPLEREVGDRPPPLLPLFHPSWTRAILTAALSTRVPGGTIDTGRAVDLIARGRAVTALPRRTRPTLRWGVQLLVDRSPAMAPFFRDERWIEHVIVHTAGTDQVEVFDFVACPIPAVRPRSSLSWQAYRPPPRGTPVLVLTDLGIGRPLGWSGWADTGDWLAVAGRVGRAGCPLTGFVPYSPPRWPVGLQGAFSIVEWDRRTTPSRASASSRRSRVTT